MSLLSPQLQAFSVIAQQKSVHRAAEQLHLTQTAVTQRLRGLETKLNTALFIRSRRGMQLTPEGEALLRYVNACSDFEHIALEQIHSSGEKHSVEICLSGPNSIMESRVIRQCFAVMSQFPHLLMRFTITDEENRHHQLREGISQLAIIQPEHLAREMDSKLLNPEQYVLVCAKAWGKRDLHDIIQHEYIIDYDTSDQITFEYLKKYQLFELAQHQRHFVNRTESLAMMISAGYGYGLLTKEFSQTLVERDELVILNDEKIYEQQFCLAWYPRPIMPEYLAALIENIC